MFAYAIDVVSSMLTHPSQKTVEAQAAELAELIAALQNDPELDYSKAGSEVLFQMLTVERISALLRDTGHQVRVPLRGMSRSERPLLADHVDAYVAAVRAALAR